MTNSTLDPAILNQWIGITRSDQDVLDPRQVQAMNSIVKTPSDPTSGATLPPLWHWLYFHDNTHLKKLADDGHPHKGGFLPPVALPRRMWAGGRLQLLVPLKIGDRVERISTIKNVSLKQGKSGKLCFVTVHHQFNANGRGALSEEHDIVYRQPTKLSAQMQPAPEHQATDLSETIVPSPAMLFRYSALTFNAHRIHYDRQYCRDVENYPGLVFHGPLTATLLANLAGHHRAGKWMRKFEFKAVAPLFDSNRFTINARIDNNITELWASNHRDELAMTAHAEFE